MTVVYTVRNSAAVITIDRDEKLNAFTYEMIAALREAVKRADADPAVAGIVITGAGRAFSAGLDMDALSQSAARAREGRGGDPREEGDLPALFSYLLRVGKPVIAAVNGVAAGGGFVLAMLCDLRFVSEAASFTTVFSKRGLIAEHLTSFILPRMIGTSRALDLLWSSEKIDAEEAYRIGLADRLLPSEVLVERAIAYVDKLAATVSRRSLAVIKAQVYGHLSKPMHEASWEADGSMWRALAHPDAKEGVASFVERRPPRFAPYKGDGDV
jgi:enoyl-CoA hydratase/carnithine racemase